MPTHRRINAKTKMTRCSLAADVPKSPSGPCGVIALGEHVIRARAKDRRPNTLGTVIALDPYPDRDVIVGVRFGDDVDRWVHRQHLRGLEHVMKAEDVAADLALIPSRLNAELAQTNGSEKDG